jgi:hypothetical protein
MRGRFRSANASRCRPSPERAINLRFGAGDGRLLSEPAIDVRFRAGDALVHQFRADDAEPMPTTHRASR